MFESSSTYRKRTGGDQWNSPGRANRHVKPRTTDPVAAATTIVATSTSSVASGSHRPAVPRPAPAAKATVARPATTRDAEEFDSESDEDPRPSGAVASTVVSYSSRPAAASASAKRTPQPAFVEEEEEEEDDEGVAGEGEEEAEEAAEDDAGILDVGAPSATTKGAATILRAPEPKAKGKKKAAAASGRAPRPADEHRDLKDSCALFVRFKSKKTFCDLLKRYATAAGIKGGKKGSSEGQGGGINDTLGFVGTREGLCVGISEMSAGQMRMYRELIKEMDAENYLCPDDYLEAPFYVNYQAAMGALNRLPANGALVVAVVHDAGSVGAVQEDKLAFYLECDDNELSEMKVDLINPVGGDEILFWSDCFSTDDIHCRIALENPKNFLEQCSLYLGEEPRGLSVVRRPDHGCVLTLSMSENSVRGRRAFRIPPEHVQWKTRFESSDLTFSPDLLHVLKKLQGMQVKGCTIVLTCNPDRPFEGGVPWVPTISTRTICALGEGNAYSLIDYHCRPKIDA